MQAPGTLCSPHGNKVSCPISTSMQRKSCLSTTLGAKEKSAVKLFKCAENRVLFRAYGFHSAKRTRAPLVKPPPLHLLILAGLSLMLRWAKLDSPLIAHRLQRGVALCVFLGPCASWAYASLPRC